MEILQVSGFIISNKCEDLLFGNNNVFNNNNKKDAKI